MGANLSEETLSVADPVRAAIEGNARLLAAVFAFSAVMAILALTTSFYMLEVYDRVLASRSIATLILLTLIATFGIAVFSALDALRSRLLFRLGVRVSDRLGEKMFRSMIAVSTQSGTNLARQGLRDIETVRSFLSSPGFAALTDVPFLTVFLVVLCMLHWIYFVLVIVGGASIAGVGILDQILTTRILTRSIGTTNRANSFAEDGLRNANVIEGLGISATFVSRWKDLWVESVRNGLAASDKDTLLNGVSRALRQFIYVATLGVGAVLVLNFHASGGVMIAASILSSRALAPIETLVATWKSVVATRLAYRRSLEIFRQAPKRDEGMPLPPPEGRLRAEQVTYVPPNSRKSIVANISFTLGAGESVGVIGPSASGKSTLLRLLIGVWPCQGGIVRLDDADIYAWPRRELSQYIGYLPQDVELFAGTVRQNIARLSDGNPDAVVAAAKLALAHEMILSLPAGYDTDVGEQGYQLSGGQRQRIGIARALYGTPRLVILDEPNSNLDGQGELALIQTLEELRRRKVTVVIVAHRPNIMAHVDKILALRGGMLEAFGPRSEVLQRYVSQPRGQTNVVNLSASSAES